MLLGVLQQIAQSAIEQRGIAFDVDVRSVVAQKGRIQPGPLERARHDHARFQGLERHGSEVEPGIGEQLSEQVVDLGDLAFDFVERDGIGSAAEELGKHAQSRQWTPDFVRNRREQLTLSGALGGEFELRSVAAQALHYCNYWLIAHTAKGMPPGTVVYWSLAVEEQF